jgi:glyoxylase-like metal-dependent hydrolase (beta-lactamase superfamily II)
VEVAAVLVAGFPTGAFQANCFVLAADDDSPCIVVDPGQDAEDPLDQLLVERRLTPVAVLLTHGHFDHVFAVAPVCDGHDVPAWIHPDDRLMLSDPLRGLSSGALDFFGGRLALREPRDVRALDDGAELELAGLRITVDHTPGHTRGSVVFRTATDEGRLLLSGDTLFAGSIGRTDLPGGDPVKIMESLHTKVMTLPDDTFVLPGHGPTTTIGRERASNPFLQGQAFTGEAPRRTGL